ncbi:MAG TPA: tetratricopeptide repeat protein, partial [Thermomicrobiales bacterium]|nr:tetratricopeptide repeat protein [Thermomicrobiales bacterium]
ETLARSLELAGERTWLWRVYRVLVYVSDDPLVPLRHMIDLRLATSSLEDASAYAARLIRLLSQRGELENALLYSTKVCELDPADTRAALELTVLLVQNGRANEAVDRWEQAATAGADAWVGRAALAPILTLVSEAEHWNMLADVASHLRDGGGHHLVDGYLRIAEVMEASRVLQTGAGVLLAQTDRKQAIQWLTRESASPEGSVEAEAIRRVVLTHVLTGQQQNRERADALRSAIEALDDLGAAREIPWRGLLGFTPTVAQLSSELAETCKDQGHQLESIVILRNAHERFPDDVALGQQLADGYFHAGKPGAALSVLDALASRLKEQGMLQEMASILRRMSELAPNNIRVKTRLIETFLQRGFVSEARAELLRRADLQQRAGAVAAAQESLERAAMLGWSLGFREEAFAIYQRLLELDPEASEPRHSLVMLYLQAGHVAEAVEQQRAIVDISLRANRKHDAIAALHQIIGLIPGDPDAYYRLGDLLAGLGEYGQAERVYRRLMDLTPGEVIPSAKAESMAALREQASRREGSRPA